ncbi:unnamed protein product [Hermetia illucens]|uniref:GTPase-activating protein CdGAPr n=1 Tax=Hermetia illucens TaxID=343691 RepID=A0A7R8YW54_HERIL|nr:GTPase-activating protein CdGAPr [Hermetia illucens]XP_037909545.1 GTPase-activating protein CdGAPr [Hermetia illucens]CAD7086461.1 unnamed protein product [Hermetia illucens]
MTEKIRSINISRTGAGSNSVEVSSTSVSVTHMASSGSGTGGTNISEPMPPPLLSSSLPPTTAGIGGSTVGHNAGVNVNSSQQNSMSGGGNTSGNESESELGHDLIVGAGDCNSIMNSSQISTASNDSVSITKANLSIAHNIVGSSCRFPKLEECAHFHYERVQLGPLSVRLADDKSDLLNTSIASQSISGDVAGINSVFGNLASQQSTNQTSQLRLFNQSNCWFIMKVISSRSDPFLIKRSFDNVRMLDEMLHRCVYDRKISGLRDLAQLELKNEEEVEYAVSKYLERFSKIASDSLTCGTVLTWLQLDNRGRRLPLADSETMRSINTPAVGAAYGVRRYIAQACDEISIEVGDMISVIDMPSPAESVWWRGKKSHHQKSQYEVGFFPQSCVATIGDKVPRHLQLPAPLVGQLDVSPTKPVLRKHGKLIAFFRSFILSRPSRRRLKQSGIYRERVFSCDLSEHLLNSGQEIPMVLKCCTEFIEENGIVDGIYRLSGITSNIQKLRRAFDEERVPDLNHPEIKQDIHAVSSLLKMYFRELPNPLCTYQLYGNFVEAIKTRGDATEQLRLMKETVLKLPPPHYRTLKYLATHLNKISRHSASTGMTDKNLAIVWAPNLLRSPELESGGVDALRGVGVQAVVTEYLIKNCHLIFDPNDEFNRSGGDQRLDSLTDCESLLVEQREHDQSLSLIERPKSLSAGGAKLISLEEAQERHSRVDGVDPNKSVPINAPPPNIGAYIEVGGGPSSLPDKYHTVLTVPRSWQKRKTNSWKSLFTRNPKNSNSNNDIKSISVSSPVQKEPETNPPFSESTDNDLDKIHSVPLNGQTQQKPKSIELFDGKTMDVCVRSNSIDSLRTAGHSRSVSHDSYFDLLQSPLRGVPTCPSRELSELGLNFDREEPEMRIFSESESLVSSPKVGKENIPPSRRVMRARPEEFSSATNSVNPSPKKQPRLNLLSPGDPPSSNWPTVAEECQLDESCCKRYKLEDQLPDIQFIDCSTPEHTILNSNTVYTSVQVHNPPSSLSKSSSYNDDLANTGTNDVAKKAVSNSSSSFINALFDGGDGQNITSRYSYPIVQAGSKRKDNEPVLKERFSYPGSGGNRESKYICRMPIVSDVKMNIAEEDKKDDGDNNRLNFSHKPKNRYSYCEPTSASSDLQKSPLNFILRSSSADLAKNKAEMERSKLSVATPSSPMQSPRYSLLVGETSSENSSTINTPIYDMEVGSLQIGMGTGSSSNGRNNSGVVGDDEISTSNNGQNCGIRNFDTKDFSYIVSEDSCSNLNSQLSQNASDKRDISALKRELSLDLEGGGSKMSVDLTDMSLSSNNKQIINIPSSPNNSNFTHTSDNTSQSITPSEFGYQHLNRPSNPISLENSPKFDGYEIMEHAFINYEKPPLQQSPSKTKAGSPIKATINITYNVKSPVRKTFAENESCKDDYETVNIIDSPRSAQRPLLETSFDENMVYEQVKFFKSSVSEVNQMLNNGNNEYSDMKLKAEPQRVPEMTVSLSRSSLGEVNSNLIVDDVATPKADYNESEDVLMSDNLDSLEIDQNCSLYENVELRKPPNVYENVKISPKPLKSTSESRSQSAPVGGGSHQNKTNDTTRKSAPNFSVRQLATKFETSPVEQAPPFDFSNRNSKKSDSPVSLTNRDAPCYIRAKNNAKQLNKSAQITRSLDENAFVREFGHRRMEDVTKSVQQIEKIDDTRRKSFDFARPKSLNPPKHLPELSDTDGVEFCKSSSAKYASNKLRLDLEKVDESIPKQVEVKITPTTENRISLIQNNVDLKTVAGGPDEDRNTSNMSTMKVLSGCKLDRERIEKIKEERRLQLNEKYRSESFKSKSKTELREFIRDEKQQSESLRVKSKSRGDIRSLQKDVDNLKSCESLTFPNRIRRISDEKNQNNVQEMSKTMGTATSQPGENNVKGGHLQQQMKFEKKAATGTGDFQRDREISELKSQPTTRTSSINPTREEISPKFSIRDVAAMFESRSQNQ